MSAICPAYLWLSAVIWFIFLIVGFRDERSPSKLIVSLRAFMVFLPLLALWSTK
jgi:hypothetical protein